MPISGIGSYRTTMAAFKQHWALSDAAVGGNGVVLTGDYTLPSFEQDEGTVLGAIDAVEPLAQDAADFSFQREALKNALAERVGQYRGMVAGLLAGSEFAKNAPIKPRLNGGYEVFFESLNPTRGDWSKINALTPATAPKYGAAGFTPPLLLQGGYTLAQLTSDVAALAAMWPQSEEKVREATQARDNRDAVLGPIRERMKQYREILPAMLPKNSPLLASMPRLTPPSGQTPPAADATGSWDAASQMALFQIPATSNPKVAYRSLRVTPGAKYSPEDEVTVMQIACDVTSASTLQALGNPGATASYKVYSVGPEGNENGGKAMVIVRPLP